MFYMSNSIKPSKYGTFFSKIREEKNLLVWSLWSLATLIFRRAFKFISFSETETNMTNLAS